MKFIDVILIVFEFQRHESVKICRPKTRQAITELPTIFEPDSYKFDGNSTSQKRTVFYTFAIKRKEGL
ncbi:MAG: hypothetical protein LBP59_05905 [Planctomycetaceae bacterium]|nr:hypothetical protein [Planctomycetaceae bacterium]